LSEKAAAVAAKVTRVADLSADTFVSEYLEKNQPVIVTGAMQTWKAMTEWTPERLTARFGNERVQVYGDLFRLIDITTLAQYLQRYFGQSGAGPSSAPYVRWYSHLIGDDRVPWADEIFARIADDWARPSFFPSDSFALPFCPPRATIDPSRSWFPARGLFISARGARTRLHADPWCSDALLCQIYGKKTFVMYDPSQGAYLARQGRSVDIANPDLQAFPDFPKARPAVRDTLRSGEIVLVPAGWYHHFDSVSDSISLTWNFVHRCRLREFLSYLAAGPPETEVKQLAYAYFESPGRHPLDNEGFAAMLLGSR
jgi:hypothetical protein